MASQLPALRTWLVLGRVSNLPTVWSNLLAGWYLVGGGSYSFAFIPLLFGASFLYVGGMFLNDFCDAGFDSQYRTERPIPAELISRRATGTAAANFLATGIILLATLGWKTGALAVLLTAFIVLYDIVHKKISWAPILMAACRFLLYPLAASAVAGIVTTSVLLAAGALALYVAGITYLARGESRPQKPSRWPLVLLLLPVIAPFLTHPPQIQPAPFAASALLLIWMGWLLIPLWRKTNPSIGRVVSGLLAGIVLVDAIAIAPVFGFHAAWFLILFALALLLQRVIPAT
jgi:4-hydroxybenzoate polyprenyltransferase